MTPEQAFPQIDPLSQFGRGDANTLTQANDPRLIQITGRINFSGCEGPDRRGA
jgi:hypothetical protein